MSAADDDILVAGLCGSLRPGSYSRAALALALDGAREVGARTRLIDPRDYELAFCDGNREDSDYPPDVERLRRDVAEADGLIWCTPEYHGGYSGVLKNMLDLMGFDEIEGKLVGLVGVSGGSLGGTGALSGLRAVGRALHAWVIPEQAGVPRAWKAFDDGGLLKDPDLEERVRDVGRRVARFTYLHGSAEAREFLEAWESAPDNPGGDGQ